MTDLQIANMLAYYHKECDAAETLRQKGEVQLKHARLIKRALNTTFTRFDLERAFLVGDKGEDFEEWYLANYR